MSKLYAATVAMQMVEAGALALYEPINHCLQGFQIHNPLGEREITLYDLLTHRSGINGGVDVQCDFSPTKPIGEMIKHRYQKGYLDLYGGKLLPLWKSKVGEHCQYSNLGSNTIGYLIEVTNPEGLDYPSYVQKHIIQPLGMTSSLKPMNHDPARDSGGDWDADGFRAGVLDMRAVEMNLTSINVFLESDQCQVPYEELLFIYREIAPFSSKILIPSMIP